MSPVFFQSDTIIFFSLFVFVRDINDGLIRYVRVKWRSLLDAVSSTCSLSVLLLAIEITCTIQIALVLA